MNLLFIFLDFCIKKILSIKRLYWVNKYLYLLSSRNLGVLNSENMDISGEMNLLKKLAAFLGNDAVLVDIGANTGDYTLLLREFFPKSKIYSFEPNPVAYKQLTKKTNSDDIVTFNLAIGKNDGYTTLYDYKKTTQHASLYRDVIKSIHRKSLIKYRVKTTTLDKLSMKTIPNHINFLKLDVEGSEMNVLLGSKNLLKQDSIDIIQFEFNEMNVISKVFFKDFFEILKNYRLYRLLPEGLLPIEEYNSFECEIFAYQNYLAVNKKTLFKY